jgi:excisionase family DNA binding protein
MNEQWLGTREAAEALGISLRTLYRLIDEGELTAYQIGRNIRLREGDVSAYLDKVRIKPGTLRHLIGAEMDPEMRAATRERLK